jgi:hypothetical protein
MSAIKDNLKKVTGHPVVSLVGVGIGYLVATKVVKTEKLWLKAVITVGTAVLTAIAYDKFAAKKGAPTAEIVKK